MAELLYTFEGRLLDGERELVGFDRSHGPFGRLTSAGVEYEIARRKPSGWHMELTDTRTEQQACEFLPHHIGRGGHLRSADVEVELKGRPIGPSHWCFVTPDGIRVDAAAKPMSNSGDHGSFGRLEVSLETVESVVTPSVAPLVLAFGCWLIVQWETDVVRGTGRFLGGI